MDDKIVDEINEDNKVKKTRKLRKKEKEEFELVRYVTDVNTGLLPDMIEERVEHNLVNEKLGSTTKSKKRIVFNNIFTFFNILTIAIAVWLLSVGAFKDLFFIVIVSANAIIGIYQEIKAKNTIDKLSILSNPTVNVIRDSEVCEIDIDKIVLDDLMILQAGNQICSDSIVMDGFLEVNESLLTGESDSIVKKPGDKLLSGSFVVSGTCKARVDAVGKDNYIEMLTLKVKKVEKPNSELLRTLSMIIKVMALIIVPLGTILFVMQYFNSSVDYVTSVRKTAGAVIGMIPSGLYLTTSIGFAVGVVKLSEHNVLVRELSCIEMLARVDVLCLDKTGTITDGTMSVMNTIDYTNIAGLSTKNIVSAILNATKDNNMTSQALEKKFGRAKRIKSLNVLPFSSLRKFQGVTFDKMGTFLLGAPEFILKSNYNLVKQDVLNGAQKGYRVLLIAHTTDSIENEVVNLSNVKPVSLIYIEDTIREDAIKTIEYFKTSGVEVKVISGDNPLTVSKVSERAGIVNASQFISLDGLTDEEVERAATKYTVFGRVSPSQKQLLVKTMKKAGSTVAMTGDGVNDILALKEADCSIAVASGSDAARNVSHLVLLDSNFDSMPKVVSEGRRVITNVAKVASLFLTKTIFSLLLAIYAVNRGGAYPISTNQLTMIDFLCIGLPSFFLILEPSNEKFSGHFLLNVLKGSLPGAVVILLNSYIVFALEDALYMSNQQSSTVIVVVATFTCMMVLLQTCRPFNLFKKTMFTILFSAYIFITILLPGFLDFAPVFPIGEYYDKTASMEIIEKVPSVTISKNDYLVIDGVYNDGEKYYNRSNSTNFEIKNVGGYLQINGILTPTEVTPRVSYMNDNFIFEAKTTKIQYVEDYIVTVGENGAVYINNVDTMINVLPDIRIKSGYYVIDGIDTDIEAVASEITANSIKIKDYHVYVNGYKIDHEIEKPLVSQNEDGFFCVGGYVSVLKYIINADISVDQNFNYVYNGNVLDDELYETVITVSDSGYYVIDNLYTKFKSTSDYVYNYSTNDGGYLMINGVETNYKVEILKTIGGIVPGLSISMILLMIVLCTTSWPLMAVLKNFIPWIRKQLVLARMLLNKF